jgi:hypothetical protein
MVLVTVGKLPNTTFTGGSLTTSLNQAKGAAVASAGTTNIWAGDGDLIHITGTTTITSLGTAPQAGAKRTIVFDGALTLTHNATSLILPGAANITTAAGDRMDVVADTTANMIVVNYTKASGASNGLPSPTVNATTSGSTSQFTGISATARRITLVFNEVSTSGTVKTLVQIGSGSFATTGYAGNVGYIAAGSGSVFGGSGGAITTGFMTDSAGGGLAATRRSGQVVLTHIGSNIWICSGVLADSTGGSSAFMLGGSITLGGVLDRVQLNAGADTFDNGSLAMFVE